MRGKFLVDKTPFDPEITKIERKNRKKKKQETAKPPGESSSTHFPSTEKSLVIDNMVDR